MFDHVTIRASDLPASAAFYRTVLGALGIEPTVSEADWTEWDDFSLVQADPEHPPTRHLHIGFVARSRQLVDDFWQAGVAAGYRDDGKPGERPQYSPGYYGSFLRDPDGNSAEAVDHEDTRRGGHIDHLWIGVPDLKASEDFYRLIARHTGLRGGRRGDTRVQFRGAWGTFSLLQDGRPPTTGLHVAFSAPDRATVDEFHRAATGAGYPDNGAPGERPQWHPGYYSAYVLDPDATNVESVFHGRTENV
jgi:catechol 2,3-dioxygenase-like lactoylglutathione lyase family enzyme